MNYILDWCIIMLSKGVMVRKPENAHEPKVPLELISPKLLIRMHSKQWLMKPNVFQE